MDAKLSISDVDQNLEFLFSEHPAKKIKTNKNIILFTKISIQSLLNFSIYIRIDIF